MISFDDRHGPADAAPASAYPELAVPAWYRDAKLGVFVHWGLYSVPAWADVLDRSDVTAENAYARHQYAEWYANTVRIEGSPTQRRHREIYGEGLVYEDFADSWRPGPEAADGIVDLAVRAGARYVVPTTKHHDGFCLWDSATTPFTAARRGPQQDLIGAFARAVRSAGLRLGLYYSGALDWHVSDFPPMTSNADLFALRRNDAGFASFAAAQLRELIDGFAPDLLWNDIDWPDAGKGAGPDSLQELFRRHLAAVPEGMVNDRWGVPVHGVLTREYQDIEAVQEEVFESTRGLGLSFGVNAEESEAHALDGAQLIRLLADVVSKNGNLLINVGPHADGSIPPLQSRALEHLGRWLALHAGAIYGTRPWFDPAVTVPPPGVRFTLSPADADGAGALHVLLLDPSTGPVRLGAAVLAALEDAAVLPAAGADGGGPADGAAAAVPTLRREGEDLVLVPAAGATDVQVLSLPLR
ncbi:alpha-L-fucosidase [Brachybacterium hainanense]|uniref:alpha-L-fucosidase n=1 Tax=Brachybacterium hainanense TaxID=1541174 RepID=A0ABV6RCD1_9MICO